MKKKVNGIIHMKNIDNKDIIKEILHITAHLGGGVGKALSGLAEQSIINNSRFKHTFISLEKNDKKEFENKIKECGSNVIVKPSKSEINYLLEKTDIVQLEWWNHPELIKMLCLTDFPPMRLLVWSHTSGLYNQIIPTKLIMYSDMFLFTSKCSFENSEINNLIPLNDHKMNVVNSCGGLPSKMIDEKTNISNDLNVGYFGSFNFGKLHPDYIEYVIAAEKKISNFKVKMIGDLNSKTIKDLHIRHTDEEINNVLKFAGYVPNIEDELKSINVLAYILNPYHYGTTENALIEAMSMGIVPVVLNNPAEYQIVKHSFTGFIVKNQDEFVSVMKWLKENPDERRKIGNNASNYVRNTFTPEKMENSMNNFYNKLMYKNKNESIRIFSEIFGISPNEWFISCQGDKNIFKSNGEIKLPNNELFKYGLYDINKGSAFQFNKYFPHDKNLSMWVSNLKLLQ